MDAMDIESRIGLIKSDPLEEIITEPELRSLLEGNSSPKHYFGLEISGMPHIGHLFLSGKKINDFHKAGIKTQVLLADWHTMANNKFGGDWDRIIIASKFYEKLFNIVCPNTSVILGSKLYEKNDDYWKLLMQLARRTTMARATRTLIIEGRSQRDVLHVSQYIYPIMQAADIMALDADMPHAGIDQRRIHVLAKELFDEMKLKKIVPVHHHLLASLAEPPKVEEIDKAGTKEEVVAAMKMSKSKPGSMIPVLATDEELERIVKHAWCPERIVAQNPVLELCHFIIFPINGSMNVERKSEYGGDVSYASYSQMESDFAAGKLHPMDLKRAVFESLKTIMEPVRREFRGKNEELISVFAQDAPK